MFLNRKTPNRFIASRIPLVEFQRILQSIVDHNFKCTWTPDSIKQYRLHHTDVECQTCAPHQCVWNAKCTDTWGSYTCECDTGWELIWEGAPECTLAQCPDGFYGGGTFCYQMPENGLCEDVTCRTFICKPGFVKSVGANLGTVKDKGAKVNVGRDLNEGIVCLDINECKVRNPLLCKNFDSKCL